MSQGKPHAYSEGTLVVLNQLPSRVVNRRDVISINRMPQTKRVRDDSESSKKNRESSNDCGSDES
jgi:hypothetical protein